MTDVLDRIFNIINMKLIYPNWLSVSILNYHPAIILIMVRSYETRE